MVVCGCAIVAAALPVVVPTITLSQRRSLPWETDFGLNGPTLSLRFKSSSMAAWSASLCRSNGRVSVSFSQPLKNAYNSEPSANELVVVNFYHFFFVRDPEAEVAKHLSFLQDLDIRGRIYLNEQGINAQYSGPSKDALSYVNWLREDQRFCEILVQISPAINGHAFPKLKLRYKPSLVQRNWPGESYQYKEKWLMLEPQERTEVATLFFLQLEEDFSQLPLLDLSMRATLLAPSVWREKLTAMNADGDTSFPKYVLLDVRNGYEWDIGHFQEAQRPDVDCFRSTSFGQSQTEVTASDPLANVDKNKTHILMYCTGGIRCDVYSTILRKRGFQNLYSLKGGVSHYLKSEGPAEWVGNLFVFDSRLSLPPSAYKPEASGETKGNSQDSGSNQFARCYICGSHISELRHRNCANLDCNQLFLCCKDCVRDLRGCCCSKCTAAPRLRPVLPGHQRYQKWHAYRDLELKAL